VNGFDWRHVLYRLYDAEGDLLYIGITNNLNDRFCEHSATQPWWEAVTSAAVEFRCSRDDAVAAERTAIKTERPRHNSALRATSRSVTQQARRKSLSTAPVNTDRIRHELGKATQRRLDAEAAIGASMSAAKHLIPIGHEMNFSVSELARLSGLTRRTVYALLREQAADG
jgi:predicted GIY-YIG superfamily endonuclease